MATAWSTWSARGRRFRGAKWRAARAPGKAAGPLASGVHGAAPVPSARVCVHIVLCWALSSEGKVRLWGGQAAVLQGQILGGGRVEVRGWPHVASSPGECGLRLECWHGAEAHVVTNTAVIVQVPPCSSSHSPILH